MDSNNTSADSIEKVEKEASVVAGVVRTAAALIKAVGTLIFAIVALGTAVYSVRGVGHNSQKADTSYAALRAEVIDLHNRVTVLEASVSTANQKPIVVQLPSGQVVLAHTAQPVKPPITKRLPSKLADLVSKAASEGIQEAVKEAVSPEP